STFAPLAFSSCATIALAAELPKNDAVKPVEVVRTGDYSEGVVVDHDGNLYFSHGKLISKVTPDGKHEIWAKLSAPNGHKILADGSHLVCDGDRHAVLHLDPLARELAPESTSSEGTPLRGPNDLTLDPKGGFYFTDPGGSSDEKPIGTVHYVNEDHVTRTVATNLAFPNGIVLRPGGKELLVGESKKNRILAFPVLEPGKLGPMRVLANLPTKGEGQEDNQPDGIALDADGNLFVAHYGMRQVEVVSPSGEVIRRYPGGNLTTSNVAFAGPKMDQLYMTGGDPGALFRLDLGVKGLTILPARKKTAGERFPVSGTVTFEGKPLEKGEISFVPVENSPGKAASGVIQDGKFTLTTVGEEGAQPGTYAVAIIAKGVVPAKFETVETSPLKVELKATTNTISFNLK
ncbi:MAG TPA: SMP-30/gluconolactonase/LRE family protein, partial [Isosphaeraceae bacterium]|nr:SMP-30/gluconolactonase/LRE family protein [Isosphaeraceae bacterium]